MFHRVQIRRLTCPDHGVVPTALEPILRNSPARPRCSPSCFGRKKMFGRSTTDTEINEASYGPKNRRKGNDFHISSLNVRSISDQSKTEAFDLLAVNSGCKRQRESRTVLVRRRSIFMDLIHVINVYAPTSAANETQSDMFYKDLKKVYTRLSKWDSSIIVCGDFNAVVGCSSDNPQFVGGHGTGQTSENGNRLANFAFSSRVSILNTIYPKRPNRNRLRSLSLHRLLSARFRSTAKKEKSRKFVKTKRPGGEKSWDPVRFKNTITEMLTENPPTCYEELTEAIRSAARTATHATHQLSRISEATKNLMLSRFQMIHAGQTKNADLAEINKEVRRSLENDLDKWREVKSLESAVKGRSLKKTKRALTLKSSPFTNLERPDGSTTYNRLEIRKLVHTHFSNLYAATKREPRPRYTHPDEPEILQDEAENAIVTSKANISHSSSSYSRTESSPHERENTGRLEDGEDFSPSQDHETEEGERLSSGCIVFNRLKTLHKNPYENSWCICQTNNKEDATSMGLSTLSRSVPPLHSSLFFCPEHSLSVSI
uniref:Endonuclease/exonuclease/phosphatase domain-containing protein n=1 Tax=Caenorhabditis japonica TaxID=281687 RepID=A0A8R1ISM5_CAEJA